jgi:hypothetical protein
LLSIVNEEAAINEPSVVSLRKGALLNVVVQVRSSSRISGQELTRGVEERGRVAGLSGGHEMKDGVGSSTKATWRDRIWEGGMGFKMT